MSPIPIWTFARRGSWVVAALLIGGTAVAAADKPSDGRLASPAVTDWYGHIGPRVACYPWPYDTGSALYGYPDFVCGRGPLIDLGIANLPPGFRGYGVLGSPGYGLGLRPTSAVDLRRKAFRYGPGVYFLPKADEAPRR